MKTLDFCCFTLICSNNRNDCVVRCSNVCLEHFRIFIGEPDWADLEAGRPAISITINENLIIFQQIAFRKLDNFCPFKEMSIWLAIISGGIFWNIMLFLSPLDDLFMSLKCQNHVCVEHWTSNLWTTRSN